MSVYDLKNAYLFQGLEASTLEYVASLSVELICTAGEYIYRKGEIGESFYVIAEGKVELISEQGDGTSCVVGHVSAGGHFGEVSLLSAKPRSLSVRVLSATRLFVFDGTSFKKDLLAHQAIHENLDKALAERLSLASQEWVPPVGISGAVYDSRLPRSVHAQDTSSKPSDRSGSAGTIRAMKGEFELARKIRKQVQKYAERSGPVFLCGESGTGRRLVAKQIHFNSARRSQPFIEHDIRQLDSWLWDEKLFGRKNESFPYTAGQQLGILEQVQNGTLVLFQAENLSRELQKKLCDDFSRGIFTAGDDDTDSPEGARLILVTGSELDRLQKKSIFIPQFARLFQNNRFILPPLREHKQDILTLANFYLKRYSSELNKKVKKISPDALGLLMKYDWPGNLTELSNVIHRAVMVTPSEEIVSEQIFFGLPRTEGKLVYNLLRLPKIRRLFERDLLPVVSKAIVAFFCLVIFILFFGPLNPQQNFGITLCWYIGWPLLIISFFFLPRFWCSICALSAPGKLMQKFFRPDRRFPGWLAARSGWIMALFCLVLFWIEIVFNAYDSPRLTGMILLAIALGALVFGVLFERYTWCRYVCPLGALNAVFSMPSILELRANRQMCVNQCQDHACYKGTNTTPGCPMFRHPFLVDNNKDCILCGRCIRNCQLHSIQLNLRLAPQELWSIRTPKLSDNFLIVSLGAIYFFLVYHEQFLNETRNLNFSLLSSQYLGSAAAGTILLWGAIALAWGGYLFLSRMQAMITREEYRKVQLVFGYGMIPMILGGYLAYYTKMFIHGAWQIVPNFLLLFGVKADIKEFHLLTPDGTSTLLHIMLLGGMFSSLYAVYKIFSRIEKEQLSVKHLAVPFLSICVLGITYLAVI